MKCSKCGMELEEGKLYCISCGEEIRIVPDFEPDIEHELKEALTTIVSELEEGQEEVSEPENVEAEQEQEKAPNWFSTGKKLILALIIICFSAVMIGTASFYIYRENSVDYQLNSAKEYAKGSDYEQAIDYLDKAIKMQPENPDLYFLMADYYYLNDRKDQAVIILDQLIHSDINFSEQDIESAYDKIIGIYNEEKDYEAITRLLESCEDQNIVTTYQKFVAYPPEFSYPGGAYNEVVPLKLSANTTGKIYYTLDGSLPTENSEVYTAPIFLEIGNYKVSALFINEYGIKSKIAVNQYQINLLMPPSPDVPFESGDYSQPQMITVEAEEGCEIFYTNDGSMPTANSLRYTSPIPMPLGMSVFHFISISPEGITSDVTTRVYQLTVETQISVDQAISNVIHALMREDVLLDENGKLRAMSGKNVYRFHAVVTIQDGINYYVINEYYEDSAGNQTKTERIYAVSLNDGSTYRVTYDENGKINLLPFG